MDNDENGMLSFSLFSNSLQAILPFEDSFRRQKKPNNRDDDNDVCF